MSLLKSTKAYKPFEYPWAYEAWEIQQRSHWLPEEVPMGEDVQDWRSKLSESEINLLTQIFRFFTQSDIEVNNCYMKKYSQVFQPTEVQMMLSAFSNIETVHIAAYSHILDTIGMPDVEYSAFLEYKEMKDKYEYLQQFNCSSNYEIAKTLAVFGAFTEGLQLFAMFAMLLNFPRLNKMKGMGQIVTWSVRDETLHLQSIIKLYHTFVEENLVPSEITKLKGELREICQQIITNEDAFIDLAFGLGPVEGMNEEDIKNYIRYIADRRLGQLGITSVYNLESNPIPWIDKILNNVEQANFFEQRSTEYSKAATKGDWSDAF